MILDLGRFVETGRPHWQALEQTLERLEADPSARLTLEEAERFHSLYERTADDLARLGGFAAEGELRRYLSSLVGRAYAEIHESRHPTVFHPWRWFTVEFPSTFRRHARAFQLTVLLTLMGCAFGAMAIRYDPAARDVLMPFEGLHLTPAERVAREQQEQGKELTGRKSQFSAMLMTHNTQVALTTLALGITFGVGTVIILFYNGVTLGAVAADYVLGGQSTFLLGWLLPHGVIEIPAILIAGQAGLVLAYALIGWGNRWSRADRMRSVAKDLVTLAGGAAVMLVWAGIVEAFISQYHEPVIRYSEKIVFGLLEAVALSMFLAFSGRGAATAREAARETPRENAPSKAIADQETAA
jgi:uncharacterized membrane protein SpoIIM required for sporulation